MTTDLDPRLVRATYANSLHTFACRAFAVLNPGDTLIDGHYLRALCYALERVASGDLRRLIITLPPRRLKSQVASVAFPAWLLGRNPSEKIVCASYGGSLAEDFSRQTRDLMQSRFYRRTFPETVVDPKKSGVDEFHTTAMGAGGMSKSQVSRLCAEIDERVNAFLARPLEGAWPYLWLDATYLKVREGGRIISRAVIVAVAVNEDGKREVLGVATGPSEAETFWTEFLRSLADRGLRGVKLVIADDHKGLRAAARRVFNATHQRCRIHWMRNALAHAPAKQRTAVAAMLKTIFAQETKVEAETQWEIVADALREKQPKLGALMDSSRDDVLAYMSFPREHWAQIASTNPLERVNREVKRRSDVVGIFPNDEAIIRLVGALMLETNDEWAVARRYMSLETLARVTDNPTVRLPAVAT
jgi:hypothetical protein